MIYNGKMKSKIFPYDIDIIIIDCYRFALFGAMINYVAHTRMLTLLHFINRWQRVAMGVAVRCYNAYISIKVDFLINWICCRCSLKIQPVRTSRLSLLRMDFFDCLVKLVVNQNQILYGIVKMVDLSLMDLGKVSTT